MEICDGNVSDIQPGLITVTVPYTDIERVCDRKYSKVYVCFEDGRTISREQQKKAYALMDDIARWHGDSPENVKKALKLDFVVSRLDRIYQDIFAHKGGISLGTDSITVARMFIDYLIEFVIVNNVACKEPVYMWYDDIPKYVYHCLMNKRCAVCGKHAGVHHVQRVGMGNNRKTIIHEGMLVMPLCWGVNSHHAEVHTIAQEDFDARYHIHGIPATKEICKVWGLKHECE